MWSHAVLVCRSVEQWNEQLEKHKGSSKLVVVDFTATWCGPCKMIAPILAEFAEKMPHVAFLKVDVDELQTVAQEYSVEAMPTFLFFKDGEVIDKVVGADKDALLACIVKNAAEATI